MAFVCKDICHKIEIENKNNVSYSYNQKYCSVCDKSYSFTYLVVLVAEQY